MFVELHILQNFAPSNLNRDDTGSPKNCMFGGYRRARISSQCLKRAIRKDKFAGFTVQWPDSEAVRTRRLILEIAERLTPERPIPERVTKVVSDVFAEGGIERPKVRSGKKKEEDSEDPENAADATTDPAEKDNTELLLFMGPRALDEMASAFRARWAGLQDRVQKAQLVEELGDILAKNVQVPEIALFGRMIAVDSKKPFGKRNLNVDAACQVAHAISTHEVDNEFDFFTAVDDLLPHGDTGAGMMGTVEFNSACFYRYANLDMEQLRRNLGGSANVSLHALQAFLESAIAAVPTGKQNSMAAQNPPFLVMAVVRDRRLWSLANAFARPVRPTKDEDLIAGSIRHLDEQWAKLIRMYGAQGIRGVWVTQMEAVPMNTLHDQQIASVDHLVQNVLDTARTEMAV